MKNGLLRRLAAALLVSIPAYGQSLTPIIHALGFQSADAGQNFTLPIVAQNHCVDSIVRFHNTNLVPFNFTPSGFTITVNGNVTAALSGVVQIRIDSTNTSPSCISNGLVSAPVQFLIVPPLSFTTTSLPTGAVGVNYATTVVAAGGTPPYTFEAEILPPGLNLNHQTGQITGFPTQIGVFEVPITVSDIQERYADHTYILRITSAPSITTTTLPNGARTAPYTVTNLAATGGTTPYTWSVQNGPPGLILSSAGVLSGTPTQSGSFNPLFRLTDANGILAERNVPIQITAPGLQITTTSLPNGTVGTAYQNSTLAATGSSLPLTWTLAGGGPPGLTLSTAGVLSGTPTQAGQFNNVQIAVADSSGVSANRSFSIVIANATLQITTSSLPDATRGVAYTTTLAASGGGTQRTWQTTSPLPTGITLSSGGVLSGTTQQTGSFPITFRVNDGTTSATRALTLLVNDPQTCIPFPSGFVPFANVLYVSTPNSGGDRLVVGSLQSGGLSGIGAIPAPTFSNQRFCHPTVMLGPTATNVYQNVYVPTPAERNGDFSAFAGLLLDPSSNQPFPGGIIPVSRLGSVYAWRVGQQPPASPVTITTTALPTATSFLSYQTTIAASGGVPPYTWSAPGGTPPGTTLNPTTGVLVGSPTLEGVFPFNVQVRDSANQTSTRILQLVVTGSLIITTAALRNGQVGVPYEEFFSATGGTGPYTWTSVGAPPPGLFVNPIGTITGTPTFAGTFNLSVRAIDSRGLTATRSYSITVAPLFRITNETLPPATLGTFYEQTFSASGGTTPVFWQLTGSTLPGLQLNNFSGVLSGFPTQGGSFFFTILATDSAGQQTSKVFTLVVNQGLRINPENLPNGATGTVYTQTFTVVGGTAPYNYQINGAVPGLSLNPSTGAFQGTPTQAGTFNFSLRVNDSTGLLGTKSYTLIVVSNLQITTSVLPDATERTAYTQSLTASGGTPPYSWSMTAGSLPEGLVLNPSTGSIGGTPARSGSSNITVEVSDSAGQRVTRQLAITVLPSIAVQTAGTLASGTVGVSYSTVLNVSGGTAPYAWRVRGGALPDGTQLSAAGQISGIPTAAGRFTATVEVTDTAGQTASAEIFITVNPALLRFTSSEQLPAATAGVEYQFTPSVTGGTPPYRWALNGAPTELSINADTGTIAGRLLTAGTMEFSVRVTDSGQIAAAQTVSLRIGLPAGPAVSITGLPSSSAPGQQVSPRLSIGQPYPVPINGELNLAFEPAVVVDDPAIQFASGGRRIVFNIPAGQTDAAFNAVTPGIQTGTVAGTIRVTSRLTALGTDVTPSPVPTSTIIIARQAPTITSVRINRTAGGFELIITAYATSREITSAAVRLQTTGTVQGTDFTVNLTPITGPWYQGTSSVQFGSLCTIAIPFTIQQGTSGSVSSATVTLTNAIGISQPATANF